MKTQYHLFFSGTVQGVWFRATSRNLAQKHNVSGWVRNLDDTRVEIIAEADSQDLKNYLTELKEKYRHNIVDIEKKENKYTGKYSGFTITY